MIRRGRQRVETLRRERDRVGREIQRTRDEIAVEKRRQQLEYDPPPNVARFRANEDDPRVVVIDGCIGVLSRTDEGGYPRPVEDGEKEE